MTYHERWYPGQPTTSIYRAEQRVLRNHPRDGIEFAYRFEDAHYALPLDEFDNPQGSYMQVEIQAFHVYKRTPKGFWISPTLLLPNHLQTKGRFVLLEANKHYACLTVEEAKESFIARKKRQQQIHLSRARSAEAAICALQGFTIGSIAS